MWLLEIVANIVPRDLRNTHISTDNNFSMIQIEGVTFTLRILLM